MSPYLVRFSPAGKCRVYQSWHAVTAFAKPDVIDGLSSHLETRRSPVARLVAHNGLQALCRPTALLQREMGNMGISEALGASDVIVIDGRAFHIRRVRETKINIAVRPKGT